MKKLSINDVKTSNRKLVINTILSNPGLSRLDLSILTKLSTATITTLTKELIEENIIYESEIKKSTGGRPKVGLRVTELSSVNLIFEVRHRSITFKKYKQHNIVDEKVYNMDYLDGNYMVHIITQIIKDNSKNITNAVVLLEENINQNEISYLFETSVNSDRISFSTALNMYNDIPISIESSLKYILTEEIAKAESEFIELYAFVSVDERLSTQVMYNFNCFDKTNKLKTTLELSEIFSLNNTLDMWFDTYKRINYLIENNINFSRYDVSFKNFINRLSFALDNLLIFYNLDAIFLIGNASKIPNIGRRVSKLMVNTKNLRLIDSFGTKKLDKSSNLNEALIRELYLGE